MKISKHKLKKLIKEAFNKVVLESYSKKDAPYHAEMDYEESPGGRPYTGPHAFDDDEEFEKRAREGGLDPKTGLPLDFDEEEVRKTRDRVLSTPRPGVEDLPSPSYEYDDDDDDFLY